MSVNIHVVNKEADECRFKGDTGKRLINASWPENV